MWPHRRRRKTEDSVVFAGPRCEGEAVGLFNELGQGVPAWAWVNMLAHWRPGELAQHKTPPSLRLESSGRPARC